MGRAIKQQLQAIRETDDANKHDCFIRKVPGPTWTKASAHILCFVEIYSILSCFKVFIAIQQRCIWYHFEAESRLMCAISTLSNVIVNTDWADISKYMYMQFAVVLYMSLCIVFGNNHLCVS